MKKKAPQTGLTARLRALAPGHSFIILNGEHGENPSQSIHTIARRLGMTVMVRRQDDGLRVFRVAQIDEIDESRKMIESLLYSLAKHIANQENLAPLKWAVQAGDLLFKVRKINPLRYDREVKELQQDTEREKTT